MHASDMEKRDSENKRERRRQSRESAVRRLEKKLLENGYESLEEYSTDRRHADKWLGPERIAELEQMHLLKEKEKIIFLSSIFHLTTYTILVVKFHRQ